MVTRWEPQWCGRPPNASSSHACGGHEAQADSRDGLWVRQQREGLRIVHAGTNEELDVIAENMVLLWGQTSTFVLRRV